MSPAPPSAATRQAAALAAVDELLATLHAETERRAMRGEDTWATTLIESLAEVVRALITAYPPNA